MSDQANTSGGTGGQDSLSGTGADLGGGGSNTVGPGGMGGSGYGGGTGSGSGTADVNAGHDLVSDMGENSAPNIGGVSDMGENKGTSPAPGAGGEQP